MILAILGVVVLGGVVYAGYRYFKPKVSTVVAAVEADATKVEQTVKAEVTAAVSTAQTAVVTAVNAVESVTKSL